MTKDVLIAIKGLQYASDDDNKDQRVETLTRGSYYLKNGKHYVAYEESPDGEETVKSLLKFDDTFFEVSRKGTYSVHMLFEEGKKNYTDYRTPFGNFIIGLDTESVVIEETENKMNIRISYDMEMNYEHLAKCNIEVLIKSI